MFTAQNLFKKTGTTKNPTSFIKEVYHTSFVQNVWIVNEIIIAKKVLFVSVLINFLLLFCIFGIIIYGSFKEPSFYASSYLLRSLPMTLLEKNDTGNEVPWDTMKPILLKKYEEKNEEKGVENEVLEEKK